MKIDCKAPLLDLDENPIKDGISSLTVGKAIAMLLNTKSKPKDPLKYHVLMLSFYKDAEVELDEADLKLVEEAVKEDGSNYAVVVTGQLLSILNKKS